MIKQTLPVDRTSGSKQVGRLDYVMTKNRMDTNMFVARDYCCASILAVREAITVRWCEAMRRSTIAMR